MSAFLVSKAHIDTLVAVAIAAGDVSRTEADMTGCMLWSENLLSVMHLYPGESHMAERLRVAAYTFEDLDTLPGCSAIMKLIDSYTYQACEHPGWEGSCADALTTRMYNRLVPLLNQSAYAAAPWAI